MLFFNRHIERFVALLVSLFSLVVYVATLAPSVSLWDSGEFIVCARYLEVGHPPGAPVYFLLAHFFSLFASSPANVAWCVNLFSAVSMALASGFLFLVSVYVLRMASPSASRILTIFSSAIGALSFSFAFSVWSSAVEAEVYALSILFTSFSLWLVLKWQSSRDNRLLLVLALVVGLSCGVHLLCLLIIPVATLVVGRSLYGSSWQTTFLSLLAGFALLGIIFFVIICNGLQPAMFLEKLLCVKAGLPFHSGFILFLSLLFLSLFIALFLSIKFHHLHAAILFSLLFLIGFTPNTYIIIRSSANPTLNLNQPDNVFGLHSFLNREQYGSRPLLYGPWYGSKPSGIASELRYRRDSLSYTAYNKGICYEYPASEQVVFPRMYNSSQSELYSNWVTIPEGTTPTLVDELHFFFSYQLGHMFFRYLMDNFALVFFPFLLAVIGFLGFSLSANGRFSLLISLLLLFIMGPALALYLNMPPAEPRERDYIYIGAYFAFAIFIAAGSFYSLSFAVSRFRNNSVTFLLAIILLLASPLALLATNYSVCDCSNDFRALDNARNHLDSCDENAVLFTEGDNDTYPLWYLQEVEGFRTDVRVVNFGLLGADWYVSQMTRATRGCLPLRFSIPVSSYAEGLLPDAFISTVNNDTVDVSTIVNNIAQGNNTMQLSNGDYVNFITSSHLRFIVGNDSIVTSPVNGSLYRNAIAFLDIVASNANLANSSPSHPFRPVYYVSYSTAPRLFGLPVEQTDSLPIIRLHP
ncbi:MAG: DUF2723 domain-containing protein [Bacteroidales bacterium]|nr:DUF2723 domain-containing protein [Bacteroidales bacterium]